MPFRTKTSKTNVQYERMDYSNNIIAPKGQRISAEDPDYVTYSKGKLVY